MSNVECRSREQRSSFGVCRFVVEQNGLDAMDFILTNMANMGTPRNQFHFFEGMCLRMNRWNLALLQIKLVSQAGFTALLRLQIAAMHTHKDSAGCVLQRNVQISLFLYISQEDGLFDPVLENLSSKPTKRKLKKRGTIDDVLGPELAKLGLVPSSGSPTPRSRPPSPGSGAPLSPAQLPRDSGGSPAAETQPRSDSRNSKRSASRQSRRSGSRTSMRSVEDGRQRDSHTEGTPSPDVGSGRLGGSRPSSAGSMSSNRSGSLALQTPESGREEEGSIPSRPPTPRSQADMHTMTSVISEANLSQPDAKREDTNEARGADSQTDDQQTAGSANAQVNLGSQNALLSPVDSVPDTPIRPVPLDSELGRIHSQSATLLIDDMIKATITKAEENLVRLGDDNMSRPADSASDREFSETGLDLAVSMSDYYSEAEKSQGRLIESGELQSAMNSTARNDATNTMNKNPGSSGDQNEGTTTEQNPGSRPGSASRLVNNITADIISRAEENVSRIEGQKSVSPDENAAARDEKSENVGKTAEEEVEVEKGVDEGQKKDSDTAPPTKKASVVSFQDVDEEDHPHEKVRKGTPLPDDVDEEGAGKVFFENVSSSDEEDRPHQKMRKGTPVSRDKKGSTVSFENPSDEDEPHVKVRPGTPISRNKSKKGSTVSFENPSDEDDEHQEKMRKGTPVPLDKSKKGSTVSFENPSDEDESHGKLRQGTPLPTEAPSGESEEENPTALDEGHSAHAPVSRLESKASVKFSIGSDDEISPPDTPLSRVRRGTPVPPLRDSDGETQGTQSPSSMAATRGSPQQTEQSEELTRLEMKNAVRFDNAEDSPHGTPRRTSVRRGTPVPESRKSGSEDEEGDASGTDERSNSGSPGTQENSGKGMKKIGSKGSVKFEEAEHVTESLNRRPKRRSTPIPPPADNDGDRSNSANSTASDPDQINEKQNGSMKKVDSKASVKFENIAPEEERPSRMQRRGTPVPAARGSSSEESQGADADATEPTSANKKTRTKKKDSKSSVQSEKAESSAESEGSTQKRRRSPNPPAREPSGDGTASLDSMVVERGSPSVSSEQSKETKRTESKGSVKVPATAEEEPSDLGSLANSPDLQAAPVDLSRESSASFLEADFEGDDEEEEELSNSRSVNDGREPNIEVIHGDDGPKVRSDDIDFVEHTQDLEAGNSLTGSLNVGSKMSNQATRPRSPLPPRNPSTNLKHTEVHSDSNKQTTTSAQKIRKNKRTSPGLIRHTKSVSPTKSASPASVTSPRGRPSYRVGPTAGQLGTLRGPPKKPIPAFSNGDPQKVFVLRDTDKSKILGPAWKPVGKATMNTNPLGTTQRPFPPVGPREVDGQNGAGDKSLMITGKPQIPSQLQSEAWWQNGKFNITIRGPETVLPPLPSCLVSVHPGSEVSSESDLITEPVDVQITFRPEEPPSNYRQHNYFRGHAPIRQGQKADRNVLNSRAAHPSFNTRIDTPKGRRGKLRPNRRPMRGHVNPAAARGRNPLNPQTPEN